MRMGWIGEMEFKYSQHIYTHDHPPVPSSRESKPRRDAALRRSEQVPACIRRARDHAHLEAHDKRGEEGKGPRHEGPDRDGEGKARGDRPWHGQMEVHQGAFAPCRL